MPAFDPKAVNPKFATFLARLKGVQERKEGTSWAACCPAHPHDTKPSLSINVGRNGNLVVSCHSSYGCTATEITKAVGLTLADLFASNKPGFERGTVRKRPAPDTVYPYHYEDGTLAYEACRYNNPKDFSQRRPNPDWKPGGTAARYVWNLEGVRLVLYRLPKLLQAFHKNPARWVCLVEGEKCADALEAIDVLSTTHALGSDHWRAEYAESLRGRNVAIFYDLDPYNERSRKRPGPAWAVQAARDLHAVGCRVRIVAPPGCEPDSKDDIADFILRNSAKGAERLKAEIFDCVVRAQDYFPGWEFLSGYQSLQQAARVKIDEPLGADPRELIEATIRRLEAALDGVQLGSITEDLATAAASCQWLAETIAPQLRRDNITLGRGPAEPIESAKTSEPGADDEAQQAATTKNTDATQAAEAQGEFVEPEPI